MNEITEPDSTSQPAEDIPCIAANVSPADVIAGNVLSPRSNCRNIDPILRVAREFQEENPHISLILCNHAHTLAQNLYSSTEARIMLYCIHAKMSVIQQIVANSVGADFDQSQDTTHLLEFYTRYREKYSVDNLSDDGIRILENLEVLGTVLEQKFKTVSPQEANRLVFEELRQKIKSDDVIDYNIIPIDARGKTNTITSLPEVRAAISSLEYFTDLPKLPDDARDDDVLDFLQYVFGFQTDSVSNQRENIVILLSDEQSRLSPLNRENPILNEVAVKNVFDKTFDNYTNWCTYVKEERIWKENEVTKNDQILYISLYYLIWGEAANVRFLPECLCYIFHHMGKELDGIMGQKDATHAESCLLGDGASYLKQVICPLYDVVASEADINKDGNAPYSTWRNYDDFNEYFWSRDCFEQLGWPLNKDSSFFSKPSATSTSDHSAKSTVHGKTLFIERRTFLHLYHSFHRLWILLVMMFQGLVIIAWNDGKLNFKTLHGVLSLGPTFFFMKLVQCVMDLVMMYGAHSSTRIIERFIWFMWATLSICFLYVIDLHVNTNSYLQLIIFVIYIIVLVIYVAIELYQSKLALMLNRCNISFVVRFLRKIPQEDCYVGRDLVEGRTDYVMYMLFWLLILGINFAFAYFILIIPLVSSSKDFVLENWHTVLAIGSFWVAVFCVYLLAVHIIYTVISGVVAFLLGAWDRLGKIKSMNDVHKNFESFPEAFMDNLHITLARRDFPMEKENAERFLPFWNEIVYHLREEDYITNQEWYVLRMTQSSWSVPMVRWPLFLLDNKIYDAIVSLRESDSQEEQWNRISRDFYMKYAVKECFCTVKLLLKSVLDGEGKLWVEKLYEVIEGSIETKSIFSDFQLKNLRKVIVKVAALTRILAQKEVETPELKTDAVRAAQDLYDVIMGDFLGVDMRDNLAMWKLFHDARNEGHLFSELKWPTGCELRLHVGRIRSLLTIKQSKEYIPRNLEARRRLEYFTNSLFMSMPKPEAVRKTLAFSALTPYYKEVVLYSKDELLNDIGQGNTLLGYLQITYPDEWKNFLSRMGRDESTSVAEFLKYADDKLVLELRFWASYRGQTLARTVRGMMYNRQALMLQSYMESVAVEEDSTTETKNFQFQCEARAYADLKFTYVITCQLYSEQKKEQQPKAADIALLLQRNEALRIAFIDEVVEDGQKKFFSKLVKGEINRNEKEVYSIELPGQFKLGEGKPENQNHAIIFTRGNAVQTIDMNQDNYFEETLKMRNLLQEFHGDHGIRPATILGVREHIYTERASSVASFMSKQETSFVTIAQRVLANPLKVRMHYGHPDVFDRVFHITCGGVSKASRGINVSEDIYAGFNSTLRKGNITHHEFIQVGKGRDVGLHQIATFERKVAGGNGEQVLSRDVYRLGQGLDFFRMLSFYYTSVGYYFYNWLMVITLYILLYGQLITALSGIRVAHMFIHQDLLTFLLIIYPAIYMILGSLLEQNFQMASTSYFTMQTSGSFAFFAFSLCTRMHWFGRTILHGGSGYQATGRGFDMAHTKFSESYRRYSRSHFVKAMEMILLVFFGLRALKEAPELENDIVITSGAFLAFTWIFAPLLFDPSDNYKDLDRKEDYEEWKHWLYSSGGESWEAWWGKEISHIQTFEGKAMEIILSLRFFIFQYVVYQKMDVLGAKTFFITFGICWLVAVGLLVFFEIRETRRLSSVNVQLLSKIIQSTRFILITCCVVLASIQNSIGEILFFILSFIPTGWGILSICVALKPVMKMAGLWKLVISLARFYDNAIGTVVTIINSVKLLLPVAPNKAGSAPKENVVPTTQENARRVIPDSEKAKKLEELNSSIAKAVVLVNLMQEQVEELMKVEGEFVQVPKEKEEHESSIGQVEELEQIAEDITMEDKEQEMQGAARKNDDEASTYQGKSVKQDEILSIDSTPENARIVIADYEKANKSEVLNSSTTKEIVLAKKSEVILAGLDEDDNANVKELMKVAGELVQVLKEKKEHESSIGQLEDLEQKVEDTLTSEQGEGNTPQACTRNE